MISRPPCLREGRRANVALRVSPKRSDKDSMEVSGARGELQLAILIETMAPRKAFEAFGVRGPAAWCWKKDEKPTGEWQEPIEEVRDRRRRGAFPASSCRR